jgi:hypothetical protein
MHRSLKKLLSADETSKYIIYLNCSVKIEGIHSKLSLWLDTNVHYAEKQLKVLYDK